MRDGPLLYRRLIAVNFKHHRWILIELLPQFHVITYRHVAAKNLNIKSCAELKE